MEENKLREKVKGITIHYFFAVVKGQQHDKYLGDNNKIIQV
jgi:hypothetical protein